MFCVLGSQYDAGGRGCLLPTFFFFFFFFFLGGGGGVGEGGLQYTGERFQTFYLSSFIFDIKHKCFNILMG